MTMQELREDLLLTYTTSLMLGMKFAEYGDINYYVSGNKLILTSLSESMYDEDTNSIVVPPIFDEFNTLYFKLNLEESTKIKVRVVDFGTITDIYCKEMEPSSGTTSTIGRNKALEELTNWEKMVGKNILNIYWNTFNSVRTLKELDLPVLKSLENHAFANCTLNSLPDSLENIGSYVCKGITGRSLNFKHINTSILTPFIGYWEGDEIVFNDMFLSISVLENLKVKKVKAVTTSYFGGSSQIKVNVDYLDLGKLDLGSAALFIRVDDWELDKIDKLPDMQILLRDCAGSMGEYPYKDTNYFSMNNNIFSWLRDNVTFKELHFDLGTAYHGGCFEEYLLSYLKIRLKYSDSKVYYGGKLVIGEEVV